MGCCVSKSAEPETLPPRENNKGKEKENVAEKPISTNQVELELKEEPQKKKEDKKEEKQKEPEKKQEPAEKKNEPAKEVIKEKEPENKVFHF